MNSTQTTTTTELSRQQEAVIDWALSGTGHLNLVARAGCGKTFTLVKVARQVAPHAQQGVFIGCYNKAIGEEIKLKVADIRGVEAGTWHSIGWRAWNKVAKGFHLEGQKLQHIFKDLFGERCQDCEGTGAVYGKRCQPCWGTGRAVPFSAMLLRDFVLKATSLAKQRAFGVLESIDDVAAWERLVEHFGLDEDFEDESQIEEGIAMAQTVYRESLKRCHTEIDFDDMILAPLYYKVPVAKQYSWVMIDEAQDTNPARRALALKTLAPGGRLIAVGDPAQAIYGFTGADSDSMNQIRRALGSQELPLNMTYRCPQAVVAEAQRYVPDIEAHHENPVGMVRSVTLRKESAGQASFQEEDLKPTDAVLCRKTAPLVDMAYQLMRRRVPCRVEGHDIGTGLVKLVNRFKVAKLDTLLSKVDAWQAKEVQAAQAKGNDNKAANVEDTAETIRTIIGILLSEGKSTTADLAEFVASMFKTTPEGQKAPHLTLATVHRGKGREWKRVFILGANLWMPSPWAKQDWEKEQEDNLIYVAITRAQEELVWVSVKKEEKEEA